MTLRSAPAIVARISDALTCACAVLTRYTPGQIPVQYKSDLDPVTEADREVNAVLRASLVRNGEGWLSEESADDEERLDKTQVWIVDPLDGTREFVQGIPEWSVSVAFVEYGFPVAGGICNPATGEMYLGCIGWGVTCNGTPARATARGDLRGALVLGSRSEANRGEWGRFENAGFTFRPSGSVAYKLARVAAGQADATWTLVPKHEWDVAAGLALIASADGIARALDGSPVILNQRRPLLDGLVACAPALYEQISSLLKSEKSQAIPPA